MGVLVTGHNGARELSETYREHGLTPEEFLGSQSRYLRLRDIQRLQQSAA